MNKVILMGRLTMLLDMIKETFRDNTKSENELIELYSNIDMIIIDDLGSEMANSFTNSALFDCLNYRLIHHKSTIISTNFSLSEKLYTIIQNRNENGLPIIITTRFDKHGLIERFSQSQDE